MSDVKITIDTDKPTIQKNVILPETIMSLGYHDDGKKKYQSIEVGLNYTAIQEKLGKRYKEFGVTTLDLESLRGYGETREEALEKFIKYYDAMVHQLVSFQRVLHEKGDTIDMTELDCFFKPIG